MLRTVLPLSAKAHKVCLHNRKTPRHFSLLSNTNRSNGHQSIIITYTPAYGRVTGVQASRSDLIDASSSGVGLPSDHPSDSPSSCIRLQAVIDVAHGRVSHIFCNPDVTSSNASAACPSSSPETIYERTPYGFT